MNVKRPCSKCGKTAIWMYAPMSDYWTDAERYFCDDCVSRGCSCNEDYETKIEATDELGRFFPCCEYNFCEDGYEIEE